ncbi:MAG: pentapeptide repeat-containing protein [Candidatus Aenigmarchaeota archaeon]|nr:pentapeptide repeat-containing protein [Candidatus Aenigmarchaeota archaeon]
METLTQPEFMDLYKKGQKVFENKFMQFFDISGIKFEELSFQNCSLFFCTFRNCSLKNISFEGCTIYSGSFYTGFADGLLFEKCDMELTLFDSFQFSKTSMKKCRLQWCGLINSNAANVDMSTSSQFKIITDLSQVTPHDIETIITEVMQKVGRLDVGLKLKLKEIIRQDLDRYNLKNPVEKEGKYATAGASDSPLTYGEVKGVVENFFYGAQSPYKVKKHAYERTAGYKK